MHDERFRRQMPSLFCMCILHKDINSLLQQGCFLVGLLNAQQGRSVTAKIGFSIDPDLHEKLLRRIGSILFQNHVESNLYVFVSVQFFFVFRSEFICCPFKKTVSDITW